MKTYGEALLPGPDCLPIFLDSPVHRQLEHVKGQVARLEARLETAAKLNEATSLILESAGEGIYGIDEDGYTTFLNPAAEALTGWNADDLIGKVQHAVVHHSYPNGSPYPAEECPIYLALRDGRVHHSDTEAFWRKDGSCFPVTFTSTPILRDGVPSGAVVVFRDITERRRREQWERDKTAIFLSITSHAPLEQTLGLIANVLVALYPAWPVALMLRSGAHLHLVAEGALPDAIAQQLRSQILGVDVSIYTAAAEAGIEVMGECQGSRGDRWESDLLSSEGFTCSLALPLLAGSGQVLGVMALFSRRGDCGDVAFRELARSASDMARLAIEHRQLHTELIRQSQYDHLTGLPNRLLLEDRLGQAIMRAKRQGTQVGVCYMDIDRFKSINDTFGHLAGDAFLKGVSDLLVRNMREIDTIARHGGDEFILVLPDLNDIHEAEEMCDRLLSLIKKPTLVGGQTLTPSASIGISMYPVDGEIAPLLLQHADAALYAAKQKGRDRAETFDQELGHKLQRAAELQTALHHALEKKQFVLHYQPLYRTSHELVGFEALLRWQHPELGLIGPDQFIPFAEESGLIVTIGDWVINEACWQAKQWQSASIGVPRMFVNVSAVQLSRPDFVHTIVRALTRSGLQPEMLELEITESWIVADPPTALAQLQKLRGLGIGIAIDDFGKGHSSLSCLHELSMDTIKVDRSFTARLDGSAKNSATLRTIITLAQELGLDTVVEGIETQSQLEELQSIPCGMLQGFLLAKPLDGESAGLLLAEQSSAPGMLCMQER